MKSTLRITFLIDAIITLGFGFYSFFLPHESFGTMISIPESNETLFLAILSSLSVLYIFIGLLCVIGFKAKYPSVIWIALLMVLRHSWMGITKILDIEKEWIIGNPYPDIIIHGFFLTIYSLGMYFILRQSKTKL